MPKKQNHGETKKLAQPNELSQEELNEVAGGSDRRSSGSSESGDRIESYHWFLNSDAHT